MVPVTRLHDHCLRALFQQMTFADRLSARKVCSRWSQLLARYPVTSTSSLILLVGRPPLVFFETLVNRQTGGNTRSILQHLVGEDGTPLFPRQHLTAWNSLQFSSLNEDLVQAISDTFSGIKTLYIVVHGYLSAPNQIHCLTQLLESLAPNLNTLKLFESLYGLKSEADLTRLYAAINTMSSLKHLTLEITNLPLRDLTILPTLQELHINAPGKPVGPFATMLVAHLADIKSTHLRIEFANGDDAMSHLVALPDTVRRRIVWLEPKNIYIRNLVEVPILSKFQSLTSLHITPWQTTLGHLFRQLAQMKELIQLILELHFNKDNVILDANSPPLPLAKLPSIKALQVDLHMSSHRNLEQLSLPQTMPNLQALFINFSESSQCSTCKVRPLTLALNAIRGKRCARRMFTKLLAECDQLRVIEHNRQDRLGSVVRMLAEPPEPDEMTFPTL